MDQEKKKALLHCEVAWTRRLDTELKKRGIAKVGIKWVKYKKCSMEIKIDRSGKENNMSDEGMKHKKDTKTGK